jgi:hypothetical protein
MQHPVVRARTSVSCQVSACACWLLLLGLLLFVVDKDVVLLVVLSLLCAVASAAFC